MASPIVGTNPLITPLAREIGAWHFRLFRRRRHRHLVLEHIDDATLVILPGVFNPKLFRTGEMLARHGAGMVRPHTRVLDLGCGSGIVSVFTARRGAGVVAVDINPEAVRCARINALAHDVEAAVDVREGDLFAPVRGERFDLVCFNPPYFRGRPQEPWEYAWRSDNVIDRFASDLSSVLEPDACALVILSTVAKGAWDTLAAAGLRLTILAERRLLTETLAIIEARP